MRETLPKGFARGLLFMKMKISCSLFCVFIASQVVASGHAESNPSTDESVTVTSKKITLELIQGRVTDSNGDAMPGVEVIIEGTSRGTVTDADGNYKINAEKGDVLIFSFIGMKTETIVIGNNTTINIALQDDLTVLSEIIVVAYGTAKKGAFTGSATQINAEALEGRALTNISAAIEGSAGIQFSPGSGQPGASSPIRVRGFGSVNASSAPLYVVDGVIFSGSLSSINPNDVESITVLKDAASTALYGNKAANGVVLITTKTGTSGQSKFSLNFSQGVTSRAIPEYERVSAEQYYPLLWEAYRNSLSISGNIPESDANQIASGLLPRFTSGPNVGLQNYNGGAFNDIFQNLGTNPFNVGNTEIVLPNGSLNPNARLLYPDDLDWQDELTRGGSRTNLDLSYQGGTEKTSYYASLGYLDDTGWIINSDFKRISGRINVTTQPKDWLKTGFNLAGASSTSNQAADGGSTSFVNPFFSTRRIAPIYPIYEHDPVTGEFILDSNGNRIYDLGANRVGNTNGRHAIQETLLNVDRDKIFSVTARTFVDLYFLNGFKFTANASIDKRFFNNEDFENPIVGDGAPSGRAGRTATTRTSLTFNQLLSYTKDFGEHSIEGLVGHESFEYEVNSLFGNRLEIIADGNTELINFTTTTNLSSNTVMYSTEGYLARVNYDYGDKYYLSASFRRDGSSRFDRNVRWGNFWSVGGAWRIDQESFFPQTNWLNTLKLRASYGEVGNDSNLNSTALSFFASQALFALNNNNASEPGILVSTLAAPTLEWETNSQQDVALEFSLMNDRLSGSVEYYNRETDNLLFEVPLPLSSGLDDRNQNIGTMFNRGVEVNLSGEVIKNPDFTWRLDVNASTIKNQFTKLPQEEIINGTKKLVVGGSIYDYWLRDWYGVDPADGAGLYILDDEADPNDASVRTVNGVLVTTNQNNAKYDFVGTAIPDLFGSFTNTFTYKNFRLGFLFTYQIGGETYDTNYAGLLQAGSYGTAYSTDILRRWQNPGDITDIPRLDAAQNTAFGSASDRWLISSSYIALRQINFSYDIPGSYLNGIGLSSARIYANAENLFLSTNRKGLDVNQNFNGTTQNRFTPSRIITVGANITF
ncbi:TonB-dependent receptor [Fulvivirgaceae bacterium BMA10]|uniref:TonB-dependent receptor n=1 Tax=Splendidivirga corallicola TaxID=3051826 RepID=A0ABT8KI33_9BACT|nr:TonB-dependent receptor [Fulvivirgaceae bacterium BMA10]